MAGIRSQRRGLCAGALAALVVVAPGCSFSPSVSSGGSGGNGATDGGLGGDGDGSVGTGDGDGGNNNVCEAIALVADAIPPRVMILQDLSSSLNTGERWNTLKAGMSTVVDTYNADFALGLVPFATTILDPEPRVDSDCTVNTAHVIAPRTGNAASIKSLVYNLATESLIGGTPTYQGLVEARKVLVDDDPNDGSDRVIVLVTDGEPNCLDNNGGDGATPEDIERVTKAISDFHANDAITVYVVGYDMRAGALTTMDTWASEGGSTAAFPADDTATLVDKMDIIASNLVPCEYTLESEVGDPDYVSVEIDGVGKAHGDPANGWTLGADNKTITLEGEACALLRDGDRHNLDVEVRCEIVVVVD